MAVAIELSIPEITGEIARLQLSLQHLRDTQAQLSEYLSGPEAGDADLMAAFDENKATIASQEERVQMLRIALERKGATAATNMHYAPRPVTTVTTNPIAGPEPMDMAEDEDGGLHL
ncbi:hypothetical protein FRB95_000126 [Tulasnella sp. JGI-2019a]|nr:hypothetical protein FRB93_009437 [Tulasnella sp. JGI-2019a]KAG9040197.1 hypothetical protein FRB95_000126 [Tulasnella sp. JGI-2019a]